MSAAARASQDTTVDAVGRVELLETARRVHWLRYVEFIPDVGLPVLACGADTLWDRRSFGSAAAVTCQKCKRAFARQQPQQPQQAPAAADGETTSE